MYGQTTSGTVGPSRLGIYADERWYRILSICPVCPVEAIAHVVRAHDLVAIQGAVAVSVRPNGDGDAAFEAVITGWLVLNVHQVGHSIPTVAHIGCARDFIRRKLAIFVCVGADTDCLTAVWAVIARRFIGGGDKPCGSVYTIADRSRCSIGAGQGIGAIAVIRNGAGFGGAACSGKNSDQAEGI